MKTKTVISRHTRMLKVALWAFLLAGTVFVHPLPAFALESASYRLYDTLPSYGTPGGGDTSASYLLNENGITWTQLPIASTNYQIVTAPPSVSSSSSSESSSAGSSVSSVSHPPAGGRRPRPPIPPMHPAPGKRSSSSSSRPVVSPKASSSSQGILPVPGVQPGIPGALCPSSPPRRSRTTWLRPAAPCSGPECQCERPWTFGGMCVAAARRFFPWLGLLCAILEILLLWRIFRPRSHPSLRHRR